MIFVSILNWIVDFVPQISFPFDMAAISAQIGAFIAYVNYYIALEHFAFAVLSVLTVWLASVVISVVLEVF